MHRSLIIVLTCLGLAAACHDHEAVELRGETADQWLELMRKAGQTDLDTVVEVRDAYLAATTEDTRARYVAEAGVASLGGQENQWIVADALHRLGRYAEAGPRYRALMNRPEPLIPRTRLAYREALAELGIALTEDIAVSDPAKRVSLLDRLAGIESSLPADAWSHKLEYRLALLQYQLGRADVDRLARMAARIQPTWSPEGEHDKLVHGSTLFMAEDSLRAAGRVEEADALALMLARFDEIYGTHYSTGDHGGHGVSR